MTTPEAYYEVARHLREQAEWLLHTAEVLDVMADRMCEEQIRKHPMPSPEVPEK